MVQRVNGLFLITRGLGRKTFALLFSNVNYSQLLLYRTGWDWD